MSVVCVCVVCVCVWCVCVCGVCDVCVVCVRVSACTKYPISPGKVSHVMGIKGDMCSCPHTLPGFAWWFGTYRHSNALCGV